MIEFNLENIPCDEIGHKCRCGKWLCETPDELECLDCKEKREKEGMFGLYRGQGSALRITKCKNCEGLISKSFTPEGSSV